LLRDRVERLAGAALTALPELGGKDVTILDASGAERRVSIEQLQGGDPSGYWISPWRSAAATAPAVSLTPSLGSRFARCVPIVSGAHHE
jgi:hypothetical protein